MKARKLKTLVGRNLKSFRIVVMSEVVYSPLTSDGSDHRRILGYYHSKAKADKRVDRENKMENRGLDRRKDFYSSSVLVLTNGTIAFVIGNDESKLIKVVDGTKTATR